MEDSLTAALIYLPWKRDLRQAPYILWNCSENFMAANIYFLRIILFD